MSHIPTSRVVLAVIAAVVGVLLWKFPNVVNPVVASTALFIVLDSFRGH